MTIKRLRTLVAISEAKTFSAAASLVNVTHAAVSQQMQALEAELGVELFTRDTRTPALTPMAQQIVKRARKLISDYDALVPSDLSDAGPSGSVTFGALRTTLTGLTPRAMAMLKVRFPQVRMHIRPGLTQMLLPDIERGFLDAAIVTQPHLMPEGLQFRALAIEPMQLITSLQEPGSDPLALLKERPFIRFNREAVLGTLIDNWLIKKNIRVSETMELDSPEAIASMVQADLGVSIVPDLVVKSREAVRVKQVDLGPEAPTRTLGIAYRKDQFRTNTVNAIFDAFSHVINEDGPQEVLWT